MALGAKTGGRKVGTPNRRTAELAERLAELDFDPVAVLAEIANDGSAPPELRLRAAVDLMPYIYPKRKATEHSVKEALEVRISHVAIHDLRSKDYGEGKPQQPRLEAIA